MSRDTNRTEMFRHVFLPVAACALAVLVCLLLYLHDNKYTVTGPQACDGALVLDGDALEAHPLLFLVEGWEYYGGRLLTPADFAVSLPLPDAYVYIGQYGGFDHNDFDASPHGSASYRLHVTLPAETRTYTLELPEIFSAYRLYLNDREAAAMGVPEPEGYRPATGNRTVSIEVDRELDILVAVSDFTHIYSGMVYPPAFGEPEAVFDLLGARLVFRSLLTAFALAIGLISILIGMLSGRSLSAVLYGLVCLLFVGYTAYPVWQNFSRSYSPLYAIENFSFCGMLAVVMLLLQTLYGQKSRWRRFFIGFGGLMCLFSLLMPLLAPGSNLRLMATYSYLIMTYQWITAAFLTITAIRALKRGVGLQGLLCGFLVFDTAIVMDRLLPLHEPIVTAWFPELAGFVLVLCIGAAVGRELAAKYRESIVLSERQSGMERLARMQRASYELMLEKVEETNTARHDLRHHMLAIEGFLRDKAFDNLGAYLSEFHNVLARTSDAAYSRNVVVNILIQHYTRIAEQNRIHFTHRLEIRQDAGVDDVDLCAVLSNLLENAVEACMRQVDGDRSIILSITQKKTALSIYLENSAAGNVTYDEGSFPSSKAEERQGYGLQSVRAITERYGGEAEFRYDAEIGMFHSIVLLTLS